MFIRLNDGCLWRIHKRGSNCWRNGPLPRFLVFRWSLRLQKVVRCIFGGVRVDKPTQLAQKDEPMRSTPAQLGSRWRPPFWRHLRRKEQIRGHFSLYLKGPHTDKPAPYSPILQTGLMLLLIQVMYPHRLYLSYQKLWYMPPSATKATRVGWGAHFTCGLSYQNPAEVTCCKLIFHKRPQIYNPFFSSRMYRL